ncbi:MerR family transcriptional regulator, partial [Staphylococcus aureus]
MDKLTIDDLSKKLNISKSKLRYYEKIKLIEGIERDETNNRVYSEKDFELINLIVCMRGLGVS